MNDAYLNYLEEEFNRAYKKMCEQLLEDIRLMEYKNDFDKLINEETNSDQSRGVSLKGNHGEEKVQS